MIKVNQMNRVMNETRNDLVEIVPVVNADDRNRNQNLPVKRKVADRNDVHLDQNRRNKKMEVMIGHQIIRKKIQRHRRHDVNDKEVIQETKRMKMIDE